MPANETSALNAGRMRTGLVAGGVLLTLTIIAFYLQRYGLSTLAVNHAAIRSWLDGEGLYTYRAPGTQAGAALPPALAVLHVPLALLPLRLAGWLLALTGTAALLGIAQVVAGPVARRYGHRRLPFVLAVAALALLAEPVRAAVGLGRPELLILALIAADLVALRRTARTPRRTAVPWLFSRFSTGRSAQSEVNPSGRGRLRRVWAGGSWAGAGIGLATALSATPLLFVVYLLITKQRRAVVTALSTTAVVTLAALVAAPEETLTWHGTTMWELARPAPISDLDNQSLAGVMARLYGFPAPPVLVWFSFGILLLAVGLIRARSAHGDGDEVAAFTLIGLTAAATGPMTTAAESLWLLPALLILADTGLRRRNVRLPRSARLTGTGFLTAAVLGYLTLIFTPTWSLRWSIPAFTMILLVNALPWRQSVPALPNPRPTSRRAAIPLPRGG